MSDTDVTALDPLSLAVLAAAITPSDVLKNRRFLDVVFFLGVERPRAVSVYAEVTDVFGWNGQSVSAAEAMA